MKHKYMDYFYPILDKTEVCKFICLNEIFRSTLITYYDTAILFVRLANLISLFVEL
jgi:hypothetical protein